jgi:hypothetical protein
MPTPISELTLDEVVGLLIEGEEIEVTGGELFSLRSADSRALLAFYNQDRQAYWNPDKDSSILKGEIDRLLLALDIPQKHLRSERILPLGARNGGSQKLKLTVFVGYTATAATKAEIQMSSPMISVRT